MSAPRIAECHANFECRLVDSSLINRYSLFVFEVVKGYARTTPKFPKTLHYRGDGLLHDRRAHRQTVSQGLQAEMLRA